MTLSTDDITILPVVRSIHGQKQRVYYYQGNIFGTLALHGSEVGRVARALREFNKTHADLIKRDQSSPDYRTLAQLADL